MPLTYFLKSKFVLKIKPIFRRLLLKTDIAALVYFTYVYVAFKFLAIGFEYLSQGRREKDRTPGVSEEGGQFSDPMRFFLAQTLF